MAGLFAEFDPQKNTPSGGLFAEFMKPSWTDPTDSLPPVERDRAIQQRRSKMGADNDPNVVTEVERPKSGIQVRNDTTSPTVKLKSPSLQQVGSALGQTAKNIGGALGNVASKGLAAVQAGAHDIGVGLASGAQTTDKWLTSKILPKHYDKYGSGVLFGDTLEGYIYAQERQAEQSQAHADEGSGAVGKTLTGALRAIPRMTSGLPIFAASSVGSYARDAENEGANLDQQMLYGILGGATETTLERALGVVPGVRGLKNTIQGGVKGLAKTIGGEALEEGITDPILNTYRKLIYKPDLPVFSTTEDAVINPAQMGQSALSGGVLAAILAPFGMGGQKAPIQAKQQVQQPTDFTPIGGNAQQQAAPTAEAAPIGEKLPEPVNKVVMDSPKSKTNFKQALNKFYTSTVDTQKPITDFSKAAGDKTGVLASNTRNAGGTVDYIFTDALVDRQGNKIGDSLEEVTAQIPKGKEESFWNYMMQRHNIDRAREGKHVIPNYTPEMSIQATAEIETTNPEFKAIGDNVTNWIDNFMREWGVNAGTIDSEVYDSLRDTYKSYFPTQREFSELEKSMPDGVRKQFIDQSSPIKRATGSKRDVNNPVENIMHLVNRTVKTARHNEVKQSLLNSVRGNPALAEYAEVIPAQEGMFANTDNVISVLENGKPVYLRINDKSLLDALKGLPKVINNAKTMRKITNTFKGLITQKNPLFAIRNMMRDIPTAYVYGSEGNPLIFGKDLVKASKDILTNSENYQRYRAVGGGMSNFFTGNAQASVKKLNQKGFHPLKGIEIINNMVETAPRLAEFNRVFEATGDVQQALDASNNVTVNFARGGNFTKSAEPFVPYLNAGVQGLDRFVKSFKTPKTALATLIKSGIAVTLPEIILYFINRDREEYKELDNRTKDNYFLIPKSDGTFFKIPKSRELGVVFGALFQRVARAVEGENLNSAFKGYVNSLATNFAPANPIENNILAPAFINLKSNKDFANRSIVPQGMIMDKRSPYLQYDEKTTEIAKWLGELLNASPKQIDYLINSYTGIIGDIIQPLATKGGDVSKVVTTQFIADPLYSNQSLTDFYDNYDKLQQEATDRNIVQDLPTSGRQNIVTDEEALRNKFSKASTAISRLNKEIKAIGATLTPDKEVRIRELKRRILDIAQEANNLLKRARGARY